MVEQFYSEDGIDKWVSENLTLPTRGFYVDAGCAHPLRYSQTAWLRARGWKGLAIDGDPAYSPEWSDIPNVLFINAVLSDKDRCNFLIEPTNALVSRVHEIGGLVESHGLDSLLQKYKAPNPIDFMSIDIEGMEATVIREAFLSGMLPYILVVEYNSCHKGRDAEVFNVCFGKGYRLAHLTDSNAVFVR